MKHCTFLFSNSFFCSSELVCGSVYLCVQVFSQEQTVQALPPYRNEKNMVGNISLEEEKEIRTENVIVSENISIVLLSFFLFVYLSSFCKKCKPISPPTQHMHTHTTLRPSLAQIELSSTFCASSNSTAIFPNMKI